MIGRYGYLAARILLATIFLFSGYGKLTDVQETAGGIAAIGLPFPVLSAVFAGVLELVCGVLLVLGRKSGWASTGLLLFMMPVTALFEHPLRGGVSALVDFLKNLAIMGDLLMVALGESDEVRADWIAVTGWRRRK